MEDWVTNGDVDESCFMEVMLNHSRIFSSIYAMAIIVVNLEGFSVDLKQHLLISNKFFALPIGHLMQLIKDIHLSLNSSLGILITTICPRHNNFVS